MNRLINAIVPRRWWYARSSFSQEGEDLVLDRLFEQQKTGFYVDVGAHHPTRFSNTYRFYLRGWRGLNIEPNPDAIAAFRRHRKRDINIVCGVASQEGRLPYFMFNEPALNSFDAALSEQRQNDRYRIVEKRDIPVKPLRMVLEESLPRKTQIDFMSVDVEGYDLQVLESNDWSRFRPGCLLVESVGFDLGKPSHEPIHRFLDTNNYQLFAKTFHTVFYLDGRVAERVP